MDSKYYLFSNQSIGVLNQCIDTALKQNGLTILQDVNKLIEEFTNNVVSEYGDGLKLITVSDDGINMIKRLIDIHLKVHGISAHTGVFSIIRSIVAPLDPVKEKKEEAKEEQKVELSQDSSQTVDGNE